MGLLDLSGVTVGGLDPYNMHALFVNMDNMWTERFGNYDCLVLNGMDNNSSNITFEPIISIYSITILVMKSFKNDGQCFWRMFMNIRRIISRNGISHLTFFGNSHLTNYTNRQTNQCSLYSTLCECTSK